MVNRKNVPLTGTKYEGQPLNITRFSSVNNYKRKYKCFNSIRKWKSMWCNVSISRLSLESLHVQISSFWITSYYKFKVSKSRLKCYIHRTESLETRYKHIHISHEVSIRLEHFINTMTRQNTNQNRFSKLLNY